MMKIPEIGAMAYTRLLGIPSRAEYTFSALITSLKPPTVMTKMANRRIRRSTNVISARFPAGFKLSRTSTRHMCCLVKNA